MLKGLGCFKFAATGFCVVALCHGQESGRDFHAFVAIEPHHFRLFLNRYRAGEMSDFSAYGHELARSWGREPSPAIREYVQVRHGVSFDISEEFFGRMITVLEPQSSPLAQAYPRTYASV